MPSFSFIHTADIHLDYPEAAARAILDISRGHQVLFFTCHPHVARLFRQTDPDVSVIEIEELL